MCCDCPKCSGKDEKMHCTICGDEGHTSENCPHRLALTNEST